MNDFNKLSYDVIKVISEYLNNNDIYNLRKVCNKTFNIIYKLIINDIIFDYSKPLSINEDILFKIGHSKYVDSITINFQSSYREFFIPYVTHTKTYKSITILKNSMYKDDCIESNQTDNTCSNYISLIDFLLHFSNKDTTVVGYENVFNLVNIYKEHYKTIKQISDELNAGIYLSLYKGTKLVNFKKNKYSKALCTINLDKRVSTANSPIKRTI